MVTIHTVKKNELELHMLNSHKYNVEPTTPIIPRILYHFRKPKNIKNKTIHCLGIYGNTIHTLINAQKQSTFRILLLMRDGRGVMREKYIEVFLVFVILHF